MRPHLGYFDVIYHKPIYDDFSKQYYSERAPIDPVNINAHFTNKLEPVQYKSALAITGFIRGTSKEYSEVGLSSTSISSFIFLPPAYLKCYIPNPAYNLYNIRRRRDNSRCTRTRNFRYSFFPHCINSWKHISSVIKTTTTLNIFKKRYMTFFEVSCNPIYHHFGDTVNPLCSCDNNDIESTEHYLCSCDNNDIESTEHYLCSCDNNDIESTEHYLCSCDNNDIESTEHYLCSCDNNDIESTEHYLCSCDNNDIESTEHYLCSCDNNDIESTEHYLCSCDNNDIESTEHYLCSCDNNDIESTEHYRCSCDTNDIESTEHYLCSCDNNDIESTEHYLCSCDNNDIESTEHYLCSCDNNDIDSTEHYLCSCDNNDIESTEHYLCSCDNNDIESTEHYLCSCDNNDIESTEHYLLHFTTYLNIRHVLFESLVTLINSQYICDLLLSGNPNFDSQTNKIIIEGNSGRNLD